QDEERRRQGQAAVAKVTTAREMADVDVAGKLSIQEIEVRPDLVNIQGHVAQEGQGAIPDRDVERLGRSDAAIIRMRKIWLRELRALAEGRPLKTWSLPVTVLASSGMSMTGHRKGLNTGALAILSFLLCLPLPLRAAERLGQFIGTAKKESELYFVAGPTTFGGKKGLADLEAAFNRKFGLNMGMRFSAGPEMNAMAARVITELKAGGRSSTDMYLGSLGQFAHLQKENALEEVDWSKIFPWITKEMEEIPARREILVYTSPRGIIYNSNLITEQQAPKNYEDLVDSRLSSTWAAKIAVPP